MRALNRGGLIMRALNRGGDSKHSGSQNVDSRPGRDLVPKPSQARIFINFGQIFDGFLMICGWILDDFRMDWKRLIDGCCTIFQ